MCERIRTRTHTPNTILERRALLSSPEPSQASLKKKAPHGRSEFSMMAAEISRQITNTAAKLEKLTRCKFSFPVHSILTNFFMQWPKEKRYSMISQLKLV